MMKFLSDFMQKLETMDKRTAENIEKINHRLDVISPRPSEDQLKPVAEASKDRPRRERSSSKPNIEKKFLAELQDDSKFSNFHLEGR
mmetsp:Transcript_17554/g.27080  ORF Transcript_17554/g.27080 Transcript_17554/m.27080 type:complete len:87 (+) Transcript_17554:3888-4148(+)